VGDAALRIRNVFKRERVNSPIFFVQATIS
jgi:hypothetical protein